MMTKRLEELTRFATEIRYHTLKTLNQLGFGHYGGSLSAVEVLAALYGEILDVTIQNFASKERDHFVLSKGHAGPALYSALYLKGFFDRDFLWTLNRNGTHLPSHPDRNLTPGIDMTTGSLGQGMSVATGIAYGKKMVASPYYTYALVGDGELNEGQCWEAAQFAAHQQLSRLFLFVDDNKKQLDGRTAKICQTFDFVEKFTSFGWEAVRVDGASIKAILAVVQTMKDSASSRPKCIVLDTVKGQGVEFLEEMESNHHLRLSGQLLADLEEVAQSLVEEVEVIQ